MQRRMLNIYLYEEENHLKLRIIEIHALEALYGMTLEEEKKELKKQKKECLIFNCMHNSLAIYNGIEDFNDLEDVELVKLVQVCYFNNPYTFDIIKEAYTRYAYSEVTWTLSYDDEKIFLQQLGALDGAIHAFKLHTSDVGLECNILYHEKRPDFSNKISIIQNSRLASRANDAAPTQSFSRHVAGWVSAELNKDPVSKENNKTIIETLTQLLATENYTLNRVIREKLYPDMKIDELLKSICADDTLASDLLNPSIPFSQACNNLHKYISARFKFHPFEQEGMWEDAIDSAYDFLAPYNDDDDDKPVFSELQLLREGILSFSKENNTYTHQFLNTEAYKTHYAEGKPKYDSLGVDLCVISKVMKLTLLPDQHFHKGAFCFTANPPIYIWFNKFQEMKEEFWQAKVTTIYGRPAPDKGTYTSDYTEVTLLLASTIHFTKEGKFTLSFLNTNSYTQYYAKGTPNYDVLEIELRAACQLIGLRFLPGQDFHSGSVFFTPASDLYLKDCGFHITENYCKAHLNASNLFRLFKAPNDENAFHMLHDDAQISIMESLEPELPRIEIEAIWSKRL